ncbi:MAG: mngB 4, partial [Candidatus Aminicenantes bacterium]|nr:mngB 4 [Candidatus Aminicenantes bacterium]
MITTRRALAALIVIAVAGSGSGSAARPDAESEEAMKGRPKLHIISSSHQDIAWMDSPEKCIIFRDANVITPALAMMAKDPAYSFTMENMLNL